MCHYNVSVDYVLFITKFDPYMREFAEWQKSKYIFNIIAVSESTATLDEQSQKWSSKHVFDCTAETRPV